MQERPRIARRWKEAPDNERPNANLVFAQNPEDASGRPLSRTERLDGRVFYLPVTADRRADFLLVQR